MGKPWNSLSAAEREHKKLRLRAWQRANRDRIREYTQKGLAKVRSDPALKEARRLKHNAWRKNRPGKPMTPDQKEHRRLYMLVYKANHQLTEEQRSRDKTLRQIRKQKIQSDPVLRQKQREKWRVKAQRHQAKRAAAQKAFRVAHPQYHRDWKRRQSSKPEFIIRNRLHTRLHGAIHGKIKAAKTMELLGCSTAEFKAHIQSLFQPGMTWENMGSWHIDHIRPVCSFDLTDSEQQRCCFHYSNLQPLWAADNLKKWKKYEGTNGL